jgi:predicted transglutaminase-like cysteine proteinase
VWRIVNGVNSLVNRTVAPVTDLQHWGVVDRWNLAEDGMGDCEDMQLLKRKRLAEAGLPRRAMLMTVVLDENNEGHAVLMLRTDRGDFVLDNKRDEIRAWNRTDYVFVKREGQDSSAWVSLNRSMGVTTTATRR